MLHQSDQPAYSEHVYFREFSEFQNSVTVENCVAVGDILLISTASFTLPETRVFGLTFGEKRMIVDPFLSTLYSNMTDSTIAISAVSRADVW